MTVIADDGDDGYQRPYQQQPYQQQPYQQQQPSAQPPLETHDDEPPQQQQEAPEPVARPPPSHMRSALNLLRSGVEQVLNSLELAVDQAEQNPHMAEFERKADEALRHAIQVVQPHLQEAARRTEPYTSVAQQKAQELYAASEPYLQQAARVARDVADAAYESAREAFVSPAAPGAAAAAAHPFAAPEEAQPAPVDNTVSSTAKQH